ncbi:MAG: CaiB/BaiF CoA transferase family protein [Limnobacter sp.]|uniref:CaiB/BaiF CoA transferase family protein n=1 Tax=Limnobacter sp. TaxID=2003368 RepID=UPI00391D0E9E
MNTPHTTPASSEAPTTPAGPLQGLRVVELGTLIAGPFASRMMAEFGAEVIKVETPGSGDPIRKWRVLHEGNSLWWAVQARNKKSITLNLKAPEGQAVLRQLLASADFLIENFRPGQLEKWGLSPADLQALNPRLIVVRLSGYGQTGPYKDRPGFGAIAESIGGMRYLSGDVDRPPVRVGISIGDSLAGLHAVIGALMALQHRHRTGQGQVVDVALYESVFNMMESLLPEYDFAGVVRQRSGASLPGIVPSNTYTCGDGGYIVIGGNGDAIFKRLMTAIGREDMANHPGMATNDGRVQHTALIDETIAQWCQSRPIDEAVAVLEEADVPVSKIYSIADIVKDPQFQARGMIEEHPFAGGRSLKVPGVVPKLSDSPGGTRWLGPELGAHTDEVLAGLGYDAATIAQYHTQGVV